MLWIPNRRVGNRLPFFHQPHHQYLPPINRTQKTPSRVSPLPEVTVIYQQPSSYPIHSVRRLLASGKHSRDEMTQTKPTQVFALDQTTTT
jgi:hypothetical protein